MVKQAPKNSKKHEISSLAGWLGWLAGCRLAGLVCWVGGGLAACAVKFSLFFNLWTPASPFK
jgi:hypothetical protein